MKKLLTLLAVIILTVLTTKTANAWYYVTYPTTYYYTSPVYYTTPCYYYRPCYYRYWW